MNRFESSGNYEEGPTALETSERHELLADLARERERLSAEAASTEVAQNPELHSMLSRLIEGGPEMSDSRKAHMRKMIALHYNFYSKIDDAIAAEKDITFHEMVVSSVADELQEIRQMVNDGVEYLPDLWDIALEDLLGFNGEDNDAQDS